MGSFGRVGSLAVLSAVVDTRHETMVAAITFQGLENSSRPGHIRSVLRLPVDSPFSHLDVGDTLKAFLTLSNPLRLEAAQLSGSNAVCPLHSEEEALGEPILHSPGEVFREGHVHGWYRH